MDLEEQIRITKSLVKIMEKLDLQFPKEYTDEFLDSKALLIHLKDSIPTNRYVIDKRCGCIAIRDSEHSAFNKSQRLRHDMPDVVDFRMGFRVECSDGVSGWELSDDSINFIKERCDQLNGV